MQKRSSNPSRLRHRATLAAAVTLIGAGCEKPPTTAPEDRGPDASIAIAGQPALDPRVAVAAAVADARRRILPGLGDARETADLAVALADLAGALERTSSAPGPAIRQAQRVVSSLEDVVKTDASRAADLAAITLVLDRAADLK